MEVQYPVYMSEQISQDELEAKSFSRQVISWQSYYVYILLLSSYLFLYLYIYVVSLSFVLSLYESNTTYIIALSKT